ncbi:hypothetical protein AMAG_13493 [Allomyces macrogynus ATCC 38327]|uniref:G-protein coupled receptors family 3 profile domain-containing protein n=1 Tax=Allomyces macrogynus (strain ATCC 38327) TaxID=578462 RepID=A0A0L0T1X4_ALLM3|nr:hypothetical protein AMAG_13493 [Allomyces macrogynus ATCC 38327]|eukprot:KNE68853.1 hypothetical protein AMAG_13493 [Allomyces macrogynus ATCC 38327]
MHGPDALLSRPPGTHCALDPADYIGGLSQSVGRILNVSLPLWNANLATPLGHTFELRFYDTKNSNRLSAVTAARMSAENGDTALISDFLSSNVIPSALAVSKDHVFICSGGATANDLSDNSTFPYFFRTMAPDNYGATVAAATLQYFNWSMVNVISSTDPYGSSMSSRLTALASTFGYSIAMSSDISPSATVANARAVLEPLANSPSRVTLLLTSPAAIVSILGAAKQLGFSPREWVWLAGEGGKLARSLVPATDMAYLEGMLVTYPTEEDVTSPTFIALSNAYAAAYNGTDLCHTDGAYWFFTQTCGEAHVRGILALALKFGAAAVQSRNHNATLADYLVPFMSSTGPVSYVGGDRSGLYKILNVQNGTLVPVMTIDDNLNVNASVPVLFSGGRTQVPSWRPTLTLAMVQFSDPGAIAILSLCSLSLYSTLGAWTYLFRNRRAKLVRHHGFPFLSMVTVGLVLNLLAPFLWTGGVPTRAMCKTSNWLVTLGTCTVLSTLVARAYRIFSIFDNRVLAKSRSTRTRVILLRMLIAPAIQVALLASDSIFVPTAPVMTVTRSTYFYTCQTGGDETLHNVLIYTSGSVNIILVFTTTYLSFRTRKIHTAYQETAYLSLTTQHLVFVLILSGALLILFIGNPVAAYYVQSVAVLWGSAMVSYTMLWRLVRAHRRETAAVDQSMAMSQHDWGDHGVSGAVGTHSAAAAPAVRSNVGESIATGASRVVGKALIGRFPVKKINRLLSPWRMRTLSLLTTEGILVIAPPEDTHAPHTKPASAWTLTQTTLDATVANLPLCIAIAHAGADALAVQFGSETDRDTWVRRLSASGVIPRQSTTGGETGGGGGRRGETVEKGGSAAAGGGGGAARLVAAGPVVPARTAAAAWTVSTRVAEEEAVDAAGTAPSLTSPRPSLAP